MRRNKATLNQIHFDDLYRDNPDPWGYEGSGDNAKKYAETIKILTQERYENVLEIGCSNGLFTELLANKSDQLLAIDISEEPLKAAKNRLSTNTNVTFKKAFIPDSFPKGSYDLIVLSEVGYYLNLRDLVDTKNLIRDHLKFGGQLLLVHSYNLTEARPLSSNQVHEVFLRDEAFTAKSGFKSDDYRLDFLQKNKA